MKRFILYCLLGILSCVSPAMAQDDLEIQNKVNLLTEIQKNIEQVDQFIAKKKFDKAMEKAQSALAIALNNFGEKHPIVPACYISISDVYSKMSDYPKAIESLQIALSLFMDIPNNEQMLSLTYRQIADVYFQSGKQDLAEEYSQKAVEVISELKKDGERYVEAQLQLAKQYKYSMKFTEATQILKEVEPLILRDNGAESIQMAELYINLGEACSMHQVEDSRSYFERALSILLKNYPKQNKHIASCYEGLGSYYKNIDLNIAVDNFQKALSYYSKDKNNKFLNMSTIYRNLSEIYIDQQKYDLAEDNLNKAIRLLQNAFSDTIITLAPMYQNLAKVYLIQNKEDAANQCFQKAEQLYKHYVGEHNQYVYLLYMDIGNFYENHLSNADKGIEYYQKALVEVYNLGGDDYNLALAIYAAIAQLYMSKGELDLAAQYADKMLEIYDPQKESMPELIAIAYVVYAYDATQKEDWKTVRLNAQKVIDIFSDLNDEQNPLLQSMHQLLQLLDENGL